MKRIRRPTPLLSRHKLDQKALQRSRRDLKCAEKRIRQLIEANTTLTAEIIELRRTESTCRSLFENSAVGMYRMTLTGRFLEANSAMAHMLGYNSPQDLLSNVTNLLQQLYVNPDLRNNLTMLFNDNIVEGFEVQFYRKDKSIIWVSLNESAICDDTGTVIYYEGMATDITERKRAEEALRFSEARYRTLHRDIPTMIFTLDTQGKVLSVNPYGAKQLGYSIEELEGKPVLSVFHLDDRPAVTDQLQRCLQNPDQVYRWQFRKIRKDGKTMWVEELAQAVNDLNGVTNVLVVCRDISERIQTEEMLRKAHDELEHKVAERTKELSEANVKLKELDQLKSMFIASISHELGTPLNSVIGFSGVLLNGWAGPLNEEQKENVESIQKSGKHLLSLLNDVIDVSKIEAGQIEARLNDFDVHDLLVEAMDHISIEAERKNLELTLDAANVMLHSDRRRLLQCVVNLLTNAVKFTNKGSIRLAAKIIDGDLQGSESEKTGLMDISVEDTGIGIRKEDMPKLFQPFSRIVSSHTTVIPGTGLGLYLTKRLVTGVLKGDLLCTSSHGQGSTFTIRIKLRPSDQTGGEENE
ncbi:PAS domain S-box protein [Pelotalea chapellei]|uniref:histidine kinase n=1 Tax=Pelotalea chapellei TaxID=44671 RepID=A0ABS5U3H4_9BACT|nr:PAS domain S-box protein [Pelotalea chapellei]MBT1070207.1 PAS domain S-box protein [Pelotalea chapellei]